MRTDTAQILKQFKPIFDLYEGIDSFRGSPSATTSALAAQLNTLCMAIIARVAGPSSSYAQRAEAEVAKNSIGNLEICDVLVGVVAALKDDVAAGHLSTLRELIHAEVFSDFLETSEYFLSEGHKDPAAVMIGGVLEGHLRQLSAKHGVPTEKMTSDGPKPKQADGLNTELAKSGAYSKQEQKDITAWLGLRNFAAHGEYDKYTEAQVNVLLMSVRHFISRFPA